MTLFHFANCFSLTFIPPWIVYKSKLEDYSTVPMGMQAAFVYAATQVLQMVLTATFVPSSAGDQRFDAAQELMKAFITLADCLGLQYLFQQKRTAHGAAFIGLTWATTESFLHRMVPLWLEAGSAQFSWHHTIISIEANIGIVTHACFALLVWMYLRRPQLRSQIAVVVLSQRFIVPLVTSYLRYEAMAEWPFVAVGAEVAMAMVLMLVTRGLLAQLEATR
uniref:BOS complex subunit TMEM147 n=1 Tax=Hemiselmis andersenii TaxID=464988 RepID=A0A6U4WDD8_HEMAN|mmetsp:Transcript_43057/g.99985  ORF Transcript_43057/g.99985 Transcript_43057/m.99985 type:complete len:221 (+) Transcript_43057:120-782(+)